MNVEKLRALGPSVRTGGKGSVRRKKLVKPRASAASDKNLNQVLGRLQCTPWNDIEEVKFFHTDQKVTTFTKPSIQANFGANLFIIRGQHLDSVQADPTHDTTADSIPELVENTQMEQNLFKLPDTVDFEAVADKD